MQSECSNAREAWMSLFCDDIENIWKMERKELRLATMAFYVLTQEFKRIEHNVKRAMRKYEEKLESMDNDKKFELPLTSELFVSKPLRSETSKTNINDVRDLVTTQLSRSPKLHKRRKIPIQKRVLISPPFRKNDKTSTNNDVFKSPIRKCLIELDVFQEENANKPQFEVKTPLEMKKLESVDVVDTSVIIEDTPKQSSAKKLKRAKTVGIKGMQGKHKKTKEKPTFTITQMFEYLPQAGTPNGKKENDIQQGTVDDETFFALAEENREDISNKQNECAKAFFEDYDKIPVAKSTSPRHVHKTETVRRKVDRMKLPGWSCTDCKQYYEGLNLSPEELSKRMNACSKHRNKFPPLNETPRGYWDVAMPFTQNNELSDASLLKF